MRLRFRDVLPQVVILFFLGTALVATSLANEQRRNVLFIVTDDMNNDLGCYGNDAVMSPSIDALARRGMRFDRAYCQVPLCNPSRVSFLSGLHPGQTGVHTLGVPTRTHLGDRVMLPEHFRNHGYFTAQVGKIFHTGDEHEDPRSWDFMLREFGKRPEESEILFGGEPIGPTKHTIDWSALKTDDAETPDGIVARKGAEILRDLSESEKPFFLAVGFRRPHAPFAAPKKYFDLYPPAAIALPKSPPLGHFESLLPAAHNHEPPTIPISDKEHRELIAAYYACNSFVDAQVGVLIAAMDELDLWDSTIVVFFSDHGYHLGEHGGLWHKCSLYEESARVPLIIWAPNMQAAGKPTERLVELIDVYPTLTDLAGVETPSGLAGESLRPLLDAPDAVLKDAAFTSIARGENPAERVDEIAYMGHSIRTDRWRYIEWDGGARGRELYDHQNDPREWHNLAESPEYAETASELREKLHAHLSRSTR